MHHFAQIAVEQSYALLPWTIYSQVIGVLNAFLKM